MRDASLTLINPLGLHARAAARFVSVAKAFSSEVSIEVDTKKADDKSIMDLLLLGAPVGSKVTFTLDGVDENEACDALSALIKAGFHELDD